MISPTSNAKAPAFAVVIHEKGGAERRELFEATEISVGRVQGNDLMLPKGNVSKRHARLLYRDARFIVTDLNSTNGTYVNRRRITQATIVREGDRIYIGDFVLRIEVPGGSSADASEESIREVRSIEPGSIRPAADSIDEAVEVPGPPRVPAAPPSQPRQSDSVRHTPSTSSDAVSAGSAGSAASAGSASSARVTHDEFSLDESTATRNVVGLVIGQVVARLPGTELGIALDPGLRDNVDQLLSEAWTSVPQSGTANADQDRVLKAARAELVDLGPLSELVRDANVSEVGVVRFDRIVVTRGNQKSVEPGFSSEQSLRWAIARLCETAGAPLAEGESTVERLLPDGARVEAVLGGGNAVLLLRRLRSAGTSLEELVRRGTVSRAIATLLQQCGVARLNVLVVGARDGGSDQLLSAMALGAADGTPLWISSSSAPPSGSMSRVDTALPPAELRKAVKVASRLPGARVLVELSSGLLTSSVLDAIADGANGVVATSSAPSLSRGISRLVAALCAEGLTPAAAREAVATAFDVFVEVARLRDGRCRVLRVAEPSGVAQDAVQLADVFTFVMDRTAAGGAIEGSFVPNGNIPQVAEILRARGVILESTMFSRPPSR